MKESANENGAAAVGIYDSNGAPEEKPAEEKPAVPQRPASHLEPLEGKAPPARQLPAGGSKVERIAQHGKGLVEDLTSWVELKLKLTQIEIEERIEAKMNSLATKAVVAGLAAVGGLFFLISMGLLLAAVLIALEVSPHWSYFLGFLIVTLTLLAFAAIIRARQPDLIKSDHKVAIEEEKLTHRTPRS